MRRSMGEKGFTLVEMMVTGAIVVIMAIAGYAFSIDIARFQARHERQKEMETRLQIAMDILAREIRHAGYGVVDPLTNPAVNGDRSCDKVFSAVADVNRPGIAPRTLCNPVVPGDGGAGPDTITLLQVGNEFMGGLAASVAEGAGTLLITPSSPSVTTADVALVTLGGLATAEVTAIAPVGGNLLLTLAGPLGPSNVAFPAKFPVHSLIANLNFLSSDRYHIGNAPAGSGAPMGLALLKNGALFASGIEDLQVAYLLNDRGTALAPNQLTVDAPAPGAGYLAIRVSLMAYAPHVEPNWRNGRRPGLENRPAADDPVDGPHFVRAVLTRVVELKNDGCGAKYSVCF